MGRLVEGRWVKEEVGKTDESGRFRREPTKFHGRLGSTEFPAESGRYHLYVSYACPWAHRTLIARELLGLRDAITVSVVHPYMGENGWYFSDDFPGSTPDHVNGAKFVWELYVKADPRVTGRSTVPILWDKKSGRIVNNESREIVKMLDEAFDAPVTLYPSRLREEIERTIDGMYETVNNGVYKAGFASSQPAYEEAVEGLFAALDGYEKLLEKQRYLCGEVLTAADVFLFTTLFRFDPVYYVHFKCNIRRIEEYPALFGFLRDVYQTNEVASTCHVDHVKQHYYRSHPLLNPRGLVPKGPELKLDSAHGREKLGGGGLAKRK